MGNSGTQRGILTNSLTRFLAVYHTLVHIMLVIYGNSSLPGTDPLSSFRASGRSKVLPESLFPKNNQTKIILMPNKYTSEWQISLI